MRDRTHQRMPEREHVRRAKQVTRASSNDDILDGEVGRVVGPSMNNQGKLLVKWKKGLLEHCPTELRKLKEGEVVVVAAAAEAEAAAATAAAAALLAAAAAAAEEEEETRTPDITDDVNEVVTCVASLRTQGRRSRPAYGRPSPLRFAARATLTDGRCARTGRRIKGRTIERIS